ncbi:MAG: hypothetical protein BalsKO_13780 [Balneolaceae bacterium]
MSKKILLADDDESMVKLLDVILKKDFEVTSTYSVQEAKSKLAESDYDAVILDLNMPDENGFVLLDHIRNELNHEWLPVIVLSGKEKSEDRIQSFQHKADDYLIKPFNPVELRLRLDRLLSKYSILKSQ